MFVEKSKKMFVMVTFSIMLLMGFGMVSAADAAIYGANITVSGLENIDLAGFDVDISYDSSELLVLDYYLTDELGVIGVDADDWSMGAYDIDLFNVSVVSYLFDFDSQPDSTIIATIIFSGTESAMSSIALFYADLSDDLGMPIPYEEIDIECGIEMQAVPLPGAAWLLLAPLAGMVGIRRHNRK